MDILDKLMGIHNDIVVMLQTLDGGIIDRDHEMVRRLNDIGELVQSAWNYSHDYGYGKEDGDEPA